MSDPLGETERKEVGDRDAVEWFGSVMLLKLAENRHKAHWSTANNWYLLDRLLQECDELYLALTAHCTRPDEESARAVAKEAADVANFAMMIADNVLRAEGRES